MDKNTKTVLFMALQEDETEATADCGCVLRISDDGTDSPEFHMCAKHSRALEEAKKESITSRLMSIPPVSWRQEADAMKPEDLDGARRFLEGIAERCATFAAYLDERHGYGCGDQGHKKGVEKANKVGRLLWCKGFGYNAYHDVTV